MKTTPYDAGLDKNAANYTPLTPVSFLQWAAEVYPNRTAVIHGGRRYTWSETATRARRLASALQRAGVGRHDTVAVMLSNTPEMYEAHFGIPMSGGVINALNTRLDAEALAFMLNHGEARVLVTDRAYSDVMKKALRAANRSLLVVDVDDPEYQGEGERIGETDYERFLAAGDPGFQWNPPADEWDAISLSYTSGTTGDPKGVVAHHRGAYLNAIGNILTWDMPWFCTYLWSLPMFHCNGWCLVWSVAARAGVNVCMRRVDGPAILDAIREHKATHYCGAPIVHNMILNAPEQHRRGIGHTVHGLVAAAAPPASMIEGMDRIGFKITHVYGLTEVYGPAAVCAKHPEWESLDVAERARLNGRQGVRTLMEEGMTVMDPETMEVVPADGETMGEIMFRGNITMRGYLKNPRATEECFRGGWFHSGDLAVLQPDGYVKVKDRSKDIIISGGENISSLEVEDAIYRHPAVVACGVVARPDEKWGEVPVAYVELRDGVELTEREIIDHCRERLAHFKCPKAVVFGPVPKTSTGKIQKYLLRRKAGSADAIDV